MSWTTDYMVQCKRLGKLQVTRMELLQNLHYATTGHDRLEIDDRIEEIDMEIEECNVYLKGMVEALRKQGATSN